MFRTMKKTFLFNRNLLILILLAIAPVMKAQFTLNGEYRPRAEYRHGFKTMVSENDKAAFQISQRTRLHAGYTYQTLKFGLTLQDIRLWGETPQLNAVSNRFMLHQAWAEWAFAKNLSLKMGRQELVYDDARIFGNVDWAQQARAHDLVLLKYEKDFKLHAGLAFNQQFDQLLTTNYDLTSNYKSLQFIWFNKKIDKLSVSALFLNNGMEMKYIEEGVDKFKTMYSQTFGTHLNYKADKLGLYANAYYTTGKDITDRKLGAYNLMLGVDYALDKEWSFGAGVEVLSGTSQKEKMDNPSYVNKSFNPFYGTNHKFNGFMDYFYVGNHLNSVGLNDLFAQIGYKKHKTTVQLTAHFFSANQDIYKAEPSSSKLMSSGLGTELDFTIAYKINDIAGISAGYSQMFGTESLRVLKSGDYKQTNNWAWLMFTFKPVFIQ